MVEKSETGYDEKFILKLKKINETVKQKTFMMIEQRTTNAMLKKGTYPDVEIQEKYNAMIELERHIETDKEYKVLTDYMYLSVCPPEGTPLEILHKAVKKYLTKVKILEYSYIIKQEGENEDDIGKGLCAHIIIYHTYQKYSDFKRDFYNTFKNIIDTSHKLTPKWLNIRHCNTDQDALDRIEYMTGAKNDEHKKQEMDILYRQKYNLQNMYGDLSIKSSIV